MFLGPIAGIMMADFWILRQRHLNLPALYRHPDIYSFCGGFNLRAFAAFMLGISPNLPGLARATGRLGVPMGATYVYSLSWLVGTVIAGLVYMGLGRIWPMEETVGEEEQILNADSIERSSDVEEVVLAGSKLRSDTNQ